MLKEKLHANAIMEIDQIQVLKHISSFLDNQKIPYMITGALSVVYYGRPRASHDIDFVVEIHPPEVKRIVDAFKKLSAEYLIQTEAIDEAVKKRGLFNAIFLPTYTKLDFWLLTTDPFDRERFKRKQRINLLGQMMTISTAEDTILQKLRWYKEASIEKHIVDAAFVYQLQKKLDKKYLEYWAEKLHVSTSLQELKKMNLDHYI